MHEVPRQVYVSGMQQMPTCICILNATSRQRKREIKKNNSQMSSLYEVQGMPKKVEWTLFSQERKSLQAVLLQATEMQRV